MSKASKTILNEICEINPRIDKTKIPDSLKVSFVPMAAVGPGDGKIDVSLKRPFSEVKKGFTPFQSGDVLFAKITPCMENSKITVVPKLENKYGFGSTEFHVIRPKESVEARYIYYFISRLEYRKEAASKMTGAVGQKRVPVDFLKQTEIPLVPLNEQKLIVSEIEKQFSRLDEAVAALKKIKANLKRYKASVLKAAVEGKLTEEWRKNNVGANLRVRPNSKKGQSHRIAPTEHETGADLLKRILAERKKKWESEHPGKKYKELATPDTSHLPELPKGWVWATWEMILAPEEGAFRRGPFGSTLKKSIFVESGYKVYEQYCVINDDPSFARYFITEKKYKEMHQFTVKSRDFLISCSGTLGRITQIPDTYAPGVINQALLRVRTNSSAVDGAFFIHLFRSSYFQKQLLENTQGAAIQNVKGVRELKAISIQLPPLDEQRIIVEWVEEQLSIISEVERQVDLNLKRAERLRQAILKKAFSGRLVERYGS